MPHTAGTHITITPEHVYINGEPVSVESDSLKVSAPTPTDIQTVTLTIIPTSVAILNEDNPDTINTAREAVTRTARDEAGDNYLVSLTKAVDMLNTWNSRECNTDNAPEECSRLSEICEKYRKTQKHTLTTTKQHEWMNQFMNRR